MFAVPGWEISAKSLVAEKPTPKPDKNAHLHANPSLSNKRKRTQSEVERSRKIEGSELEQLWNQRFGEVGPHEKKQGKRTIEDTAIAARSRRNQTAESNRGLLLTEKHNTAPNSHDDAENPLSRKEKKTKNKREREQKAHSDTASAPTSSKSRSTTKPTPNDKPKPKPKPKPSTDTTPTLATLPPPPPSTTLTPLQSRMALKLTSARFRHLNQTLYTTPSSASLSLFSNTPSLFTEYHAGFTHQVNTSWPTNPVTLFISSLRTRPDLPRRKTGSCTVADLGCGDAPLARALAKDGKKMVLKIHSYDLHSPNEHVTVADISKLPLRDGEADIAIFCLSLMGTNWLDFVEECWRILRGDGKGEVWVAEVKSRFGRVTREKGRVVENSVGKKRKPQAKPKKKPADDDEEGPDEEIFAESATASTEEDATDISSFVSVFHRRGFKLKEDSVDQSNKMFVRMIFYKSGVPTAGKHKGLKWRGKEYQKQHDGKMRFTNGDEKEVDPKEEAKVLKPCVYKTR